MLGAFDFPRRSNRANQSYNCAKGSLLGVNNNRHGIYRLIARIVRGPAGHGLGA